MYQPYFLGIQRYIQSPDTKEGAVSPLCNVCLASRHATVHAAIHMSMYMMYRVDFALACSKGGELAALKDVECCIQIDISRIKLI